MATPAKDLRIRYDFVTPRGKRIDVTGSVTGYLYNKQWLLDQLLAAEPPGTKIENLRAVDAAGRPLPEQPDVLTEELPAAFVPLGATSADVYALKFDDDHPAHPGFAAKRSPEAVAKRKAELRAALAALDAEDDPSDPLMQDIR